MFQSFNSFSQPFVQKLCGKGRTPSYGSMDNDDLRKNVPLPLLKLATLCPHTSE
jgi:hypothetical protein